ncbi:MAG: hypothetical protein Q4D50_09525 [Eubacteriales bacterium]|nr:hypothetical protein [Eubacteriales bacterium]
MKKLVPNTFPMADCKIVAQIPSNKPGRIQTNQWLKKQCGIYAAGGDFFENKIQLSGVQGQALQEKWKNIGYLPEWDLRPDHPSGSFFL